MGKNEELGLPFGDGMESVAFCFDVDGTLVENDEENTDTIKLLRAFLVQKWKNVSIIVWSGGGKQYAEQRFRDVVSNDTNKVKFHSKLEYPDIEKRYDKIVAFDDIQDTRLGDVNAIVRNKQ